MLQKLRGMLLLGCLLVWGIQVGLYQWLSGVIDNSLYPILFLDYLKHQFPVFASGPIRMLSLAGITAVSPPCSMTRRA